MSTEPWAAPRVRWQIDDPDSALGPPVCSHAQTRDRNELLSDLGDAIRAVQQLDPPEQQRGLVRQRSLSRGIGR